MAARVNHHHPSVRRVSIYGAPNCAEDVVEVLLLQHLDNDVVRRVQEALGDCEADDVYFASRVAGPRVLGTYGSLASGSQYEIWSSFSHKHADDARD